MLLTVYMASQSEVPACAFASFSVGLFAFFILVCKSFVSILGQSPFGVL